LQCEKGSWLFNGYSLFAAQAGGDSHWTVTTNNMLYNRLQNKNKVVEKMKLQ
jgi:hypothetical protein